MKLLKAKPTNNSLRHTLKLSKSLLFKKTGFLKKLNLKKNVSFGRSKPLGKISAWHRQLGAKKLYTPLTINTNNTKSIVIGIKHSANSSNCIALQFDLISRKFFYSNGISKITSGSLIQTKKNLLDLKLGCRTNLIKIPAGSIINNLSLPFLTKTTYIKAAGTFGQLLQITQKKARIKLPSKKIITITSESFATLGINSNEKYNLTNLGKAGRNRNLGKRPTVRGIAMNPVDHPHGGRTNGGKPSVTPWGLPTKNKYHRKRKK